MYLMKTKCKLSNCFCTNILYLLIHLRQREEIQRDRVLLCPGSWQFRSQMKVAETQVPEPLPAASQDQHWKEAEIESWN